MTKWRVKRLPNVDGKLNFEWSACDGQFGYKWDFEKMEKEVKKMAINEEKIIEI